MQSPEIALIAAVARNGAIGLGNQLIFREAADQKHFRESTMGHPVLMGRKTWDSLPPRFRPLPGRRNVVLSRDIHAQLAGAEVAHDLDQALQLLQDSPRVFVVGGAQLYALALPRAQLLVLTELDTDLDADTFFPSWNRAEFVELSSESATTAAGLRYRFVTYRRR
jgi:dihydrofolate reductase